MSGKKKSFAAEECQQIDRRLRQDGRLRDLAFFRLSLSSMALSADLLALRVADVLGAGDSVATRFRTKAKCGDSVSHLISEKAQEAIEDLIDAEGLVAHSYLFGGKSDHSKPISRRRLTTLVKDWAVIAGLDPEHYGLHSLRRAGAAHIYRVTGNLDATRRLLGHARLDDTRAYLDVEQEDVLKWAEQYSVL